MVCGGVDGAERSGAASDVGGVAWAMWSMETDEEIVVLRILLYATSQPCNVYEEICETVPTSLLSLS